MSRSESLGLGFLNRYFYRNYFCKREAADNLIPIRRWIRGHYTKLSGSNEFLCNHCNGKFISRQIRIFTKAFGGAPSI